MTPTHRGKSLWWVNERQTTREKGAVQGFCVRYRSCAEMKKQAFVPEQNLTSFHPLALCCNAQPQMQMHGLIDCSLHDI